MVVGTGEMQWSSGPSLHYYIVVQKLLLLCPCLQGALVPEILAWVLISAISVKLWLFLDACVCWLRPELQDGSPYLLAKIRAQGPHSMAEGPLPRRLSNAPLYGTCLFTAGRSILLIHPVELWEVPGVSPSVPVT